MSFIDREKLIQEAETCRETTGAFVSLIQSQPNVAIHINLNDTVDGSFSGWVRKPPDD